MKILTLSFGFLSILTTNASVSFKDSIIKSSHSLNIEVGHSTSMFLDKNIPITSKNEIWYNLNFYKLSYNVKNNLILTLNYKNYSTWRKLDYLKKGEISFIQYHAFDLSLGYLFYSKSKYFRLQPYFSVSARPSGTEEILLSNNDPSKLHEVSLAHYGYKSFGFGLGFKSQVIIKNHLTIGLDIQYNYYYEKNNLRGRIGPTDKEYLKNYKIGRQIITPALTLGYLLRF